MLSITLINQITKVIQSINKQKFSIFVFTPKMPNVITFPLIKNLLGSFLSSFNTITSPTVAIGSPIKLEYCSVGNGTIYIVNLALQFSPFLSFDVKEHIKSKTNIVKP